MFSSITENYFFFRKDEKLIQYFFIFTLEVIYLFPQDLRYHKLSAVCKLQGCMKQNVKNDKTILFRILYKIAKCTFNDNLMYFSLLSILISQR